MNWLHFGLYFTPAHVERARKAREEVPFINAWKLLHERTQSGVEQAQWAGLRYRFDDDELAGEEGIKQLASYMRRGFDEEMTFMNAVQEALVKAHSFELLRDHPAMTPEMHDELLQLLQGQLAYLNDLQYTPSYVESAMVALLQLVTGVVLEDETLVQAGANVYEAIVREDIHPQGYIGKAVEARDGGGLYRQLLVVESLVLLAEAASHIGLSLWDYSFRGVSVMTAAVYLIYYYYFPEKWRWDPDITKEPFHEYPGFLEIVQLRAAPKDLAPILEELRPIYDPSGGGLTTLSHGTTVPQKKRGLFR